MLKAGPVKVSVLVPAYNEVDNVQRTYDAIVEVFESMPDYAYEIIFTDNHSSDGTFEILESIARTDKKVTVIRFSRNVGYQRSLLVGYKTATGDCSVQIDCDLQDPPHLIPDMLALWRQGNKVVYGVRKSLTDGPVTALMRRLFYRLVNMLSEDDLPLNAGEFRLVDRKIIDQLAGVEDSSPYLRGLISAMGFRQVSFEYDRRHRTAGESKFPFKAMLGLAVDGILNHSLIPLRLASMTSLVVGTVTLLALVVYFAGWFIFGQSWPRGFATTTILLLLSMTLNAMFLGILGEYIGRIFMQSKRRPMVVVEESLNVAKRTRPARGRRPDLETA